MGIVLTSKGEIMATYREQAWEIAVGRHGYVTTREAVQRGIPGIELVKMAARGKVRHIAHGVYRFDELPATDLAPYYEAVLRVGDDSFLFGDAVLALHNLANVNPKKNSSRYQEACSSQSPRMDPIGICQCDAS